MDAKTDGRAAHTPRVEDDVLVRGKGRYAADVTEPSQAYAYFVRSPHAFARIVSVDTAAASGAAGVLGVLTAQDMAGIASLGRHPPLAGRGGKPLILPHRPPLAGERAVHIGEPVAMVVAETASAAQDAGELVAIEYEPLTPVIDARAALAPGAPQVWPEIPGNLAIDWPGLAQDPEANARRVDEIFAAAKFVTRIAVTNQRMAVASMEPRGATARYDAATDSYTLRVCSQGTTAMRDPIALIMQIPKERLRVLTDDVGGAFGLKTGPYPEYIVQLSCMLEHSGGSPLEGAWLTFPGDGTLTVNLNVQSTGQGHASVFPRPIAERLGIAADKVRHHHGDSALEIAGYASVGSRSAMTAGASIVKCIDLMIEKGKRIAAALLETAESDIAYERGAFGIVGTDRRMPLFEVAARAAALKKAGAIAEDLDTKTTTETPLTFPNGVHVAEVEIDPDTGRMQIVAYTAVDDCGNTLDAMIVEGQLHGALAQGLGQALMEQIFYDDTGQLMTGSFQDYAMPRAADMPADIRDAVHNVRATTNPLGVKGVGEAGTTASIAAVMNAVADALPGGAGAHLDMPVTAMKLCEACRQAEQKSRAEGDV